MKDNTDGKTCTINVVNQAGTYYAMLYSWGPFSGVSLTASYNSNAGPTADFTATANGRTVHFHDNSTGDNLSYKWNFGDDDNRWDYDQNPTHTYSATGTYTVTLKVTDGNGASNTKTAHAHIHDAEDGSGGGGAFGGGLLAALALLALGRRRWARCSP